MIEVRVLIDGTLLTANISKRLLGWIEKDQSLRSACWYIEERSI
jgi:hypothetical protein